MIEVGRQKNEKKHAERVDSRLTASSNSPQWENKNAGCLLLGVNTKAVTSDISGRFKRGDNSSMGLTCAAYLHTHVHTNVHVCMCTHTYTHKLLLSLEAQYYK